jgi:ADP-heptose:LPS heptosyltransferase
MHADIEAVLSLSRRICIVKPDALGDFLLALPALCSFRKRYPRAHITLLTNAVVYPLAACFDVADVVLPVPLFGHKGASAHDVQMAAQGVLTLCDGGFDATVLLRWDVDYYAAAPLVFAMNSPARIAYAVESSPLKAARNPGYNNFFTHAWVDRTVTHEVLKNAALLGLESPAPRWQLVASTLYISAAAQARCAEKLRVRGPFVAVGLSASMGRKKVSSARWIAVLQALLQCTRLPLVLFGGPEDVDFAHDLCVQTGAVSVCGQLGFAETLLALRAAVGMVSVDSFTKHAAALCGVPVVELSCQSAQGMSDAEYGGARFGAWAVPTQLVKPAVPADSCPADGCERNLPHCTEGIDALEVARACFALFHLGGT